MFNIILKPRKKQKWIGQQIEGQETDRDKNREALISDGDKKKSSTSKPNKETDPYPISCTEELPHIACEAVEPQGNIAT